jgi:hypothetical protein
MKIHTFVCNQNDSYDEKVVLCLYGFGCSLLGM